MTIDTIRTPKVLPNDDLTKLLDTCVPTLKNRSIIAITSKIVALTQGRVVPVDSVPKEQLIWQEAERYLPAADNPYGMTLTIKGGHLIPTAGIDESNGQDVYILWPAHLQATANQLRRYLVDRFGVEQLGIIITDSSTRPLRRGTAGIALAHSGFRALNNYIGQPDLFGRPMRVTQASLLDGLAAAAVLVMGEGRERTPLAVLTDLPMIRFQRRNPTLPELDQLAIEPDRDIYASLLHAAPWQRGGNSTC